MKKIILIVLAVLVVVVIVVFAISAMSWPKSTGNQVVLQLFLFHPGTLTVSVGTTVTWTDKDWLVKHNIIGEGWSSPNLSAGDTYSHTFSQAGTYSYRCSHHFWMRGKIIVK